MKQAVIFTGQGAQHVGMGKELYEQFSCAKAVFDEVEEVVDLPLKKLMFEGPEDKLMQTNVAQVALMANGMAVVRVLEEKKEKNLWEMGAFCAGHSLGEYTALCASGALTLSQTAFLLKARGEAFFECAQKYPGGMLAVLGMEKEALQHILSKSGSSGVCVIANDNATGQIIISGENKALDIVKIMLETAGVKKTVRLALSGAFHSPLMQEAAVKMKDIIYKVDMKTPKIPVISNVTALPEKEPELIKELLVRQITGSVLWKDSVLYMAQQGIEAFIECGGKVLTGMDKRTLPLGKHISLEKGNEEFFNS